MSEQHEWGPWIEHDGRGCPVALGETVKVDVWPNATIIGKGRFAVFRVKDCNVDWVGWPDVVRYRVRKPRALTELQQIARDVEAPMRASAQREEA